LLDATGRVMFTKTASNESIFTLNVSDLNLNAGIYFIHCQSPGQTTTGKFLVAK